MSQEPLAYLPIGAGTPTSGELAMPGSVVFEGGGEPPFLVFVTNDRFYVALAGEKAFQALAQDDFDAPVLAISEWRLEVDPSSIVEGRFPEYVAGRAFRTAATQGLIVSRPNGTRPFPVATDGSAPALTGSVGKLFFRRWRIVTGPQDQPFVLAASPEADA